MDTRKKKKNIKHPPLWIVILLIISMIGGIITSVIGIIKIENYYQPYLFGFICGGMGILVGFIISRYLKPIIVVNQNIKRNYGMTIFYISVGFIGFFLLMGSFLNQTISRLDKHADYLVIEKYRQEKSMRTPEINSLIVDFDNEPRRLVCSYEFWSSTIVGQKIRLATYISPIGFNYIEIINDK